MTDRIHQLPLSSLRESPFNPRKVYPEADLQELADSISSQGVMQPIVVRPLPDDQADIEHTHEIVFGHRRFRASALAELEEVPCIVRDMSDREAAIAQTHENAKRADVTPFEEADSFAHLMHHHGMNADQVATAVSKSRSYVYGRLKLHNAAPVVRQAYTEQGLSAEIVLELARIPNHKLQAEALKRCKSYGDNWHSTRDAKSILKGRYVFDLKEAPFDLGDSQLDPIAGACHDCPRCSLNDPDLATEPGTFCIDQICYEGKEAKQRDRYLDEAARTGHTVLEGAEAKAFMPTHWQAPTGFERTAHAGVWAQRIEGGEERIRWGDMLDRAKAEGIEPPKLTLVALDADQDPVELVKIDDLAAFKRALNLVKECETGDRHPQARDIEANWSPADRIVRNQGVWTQVRRAAILSLRDRARTLADLRLVLHEAFGTCDTFGDAGVWLGVHSDDDVDPDQVHAWIDQASPDELGVLLVANFLDEALGSYQRSAEDRIALAEAHGVDVEALAQPAEPISTPSLAARAPEVAAADAPAALAPAQAWPFPKPKAKAARAARDDQMVDAGGAAAVEHAEAQS
jgi:ParB/RepB/Spo0J family partition protein